MGIQTGVNFEKLLQTAKYLREKVPDARFWYGEYDTTHTGEIDVPPMDEAAQKAMWERYGAMPSLLASIGANAPKLTGRGTGPSLRIWGRARDAIILGR